MNNTKINSGDRNSGDHNSGDHNSGHWNSGHWNSGDHNSGDRNSGDHNSGDQNSGDHNSGYRNSGDHNSGDQNSGDHNSGDQNSGHWNSCSSESGFFNTTEPKTIRVFNKPCCVEKWNNAKKPSFIYFDLCVWVDEKGMTKQQKIDDPDFHVRGGQLQTKGYKEAWREAYNNASKEDIGLLKALPNFDADVFEGLTGIRADEEKSCVGKIVEIDGKKYQLKEYTKGGE